MVAPHLQGWTGHRYRGSPAGLERSDTEVRYIGIDVGKDKHAIAVMGEDGELVLKPQMFNGDAEGFAKLERWLGEPGDALVGLEATGHYWKNLVATLLAWGFGVVLLNPLRTRRFAESDLQRTKTDKIDAQTIARMLREKRPKPSRLPAEATDELRELVRLRDRLMQDLGDRVRQLHRAVDLGFPEFTQHVADLSSHRATALLAEYPTAKAFAAARPGAIANLKTDGRHCVGRELAEELIASAKRSVGAHHGHPYVLQVQYFCEDIASFRGRLQALDKRIDGAVVEHDLATLLTSIDGIGPNTAARVIAVIGDPAEFDSPKALAAFVGVAPSHRHSGKKTPQRASCGPNGAARLRHKLFMPTLRAIQSNAHIRAKYLALVERGKPKKLAIIACMRHLLDLIYAVAKRRSAYIPPQPKMA